MCAVSKIIVVIAHPFETLRPWSFFSARLKCLISEAIDDDGSDMIAARMTAWEGREAQQHRAATPR